MNITNSWILKGARVIDPVNNVDEVRDIYIRDGIIVEPGTISEDEAQVLELGNYVVTPGLIDIHVHLRQPGKTDAETVRTGTMAAAAGIPWIDPPWRITTASGASWKRRSTTR